MEIVMDVNEIREYLPHRYPFLFVDRVVELTLGESITAYKNISINANIQSKFLKDSFAYNSIYIS